MKSKDRKLCYYAKSLYHHAAVYEAVTAPDPHARLYDTLLLRETLRTVLNGEFEGITFPHSADFERTTAYELGKPFIESLSSANVVELFGGKDYYSKLTGYFSPTVDVSSYTITELNDNGAGLETADATHCTIPEGTNLVLGYYYSLNALQTESEMDDFFLNLLNNAVKHGDDYYAQFNIVPFGVYTPFHDKYESDCWTPLSTDTDIGKDLIADGIVRSSSTLNVSYTVVTHRNLFNNSIELYHKNVVVEESHSKSDGETRVVADIKLDEAVKIRPWTTGELVSSMQRALRDHEALYDGFPMVHMGFAADTNNDAHEDGRSAHLGLPRPEFVPMVGEDLTEAISPSFSKAWGGVLEPHELVLFIQGSSHE